jgi:hypothetical protein
MSYTDLGSAQTLFFPLREPAQWAISVMFVALRLLFPVPA